MPVQSFASAMDHILEKAGQPSVLVSALSGGMDSVVLLRLLVDWAGTAVHRPRIVAAHLNHGIRGLEAELDQEFCRAYAAGLGVEFAEQRVAAPAVARDERMGLEEAGRMLRYRFFHDIGGRGDALVLTGHHADDQAETILMHLRRGAHRRGLAGMRPYAEIPVPPGLKVRVGRPLLRVGRERMHAYALEHGLDWREDATNQDSSYARNRIRHRVIPALENLMPGFRDRLLARAEILAKEESLMTKQGAALASLLSRKEGGGRFFQLVEPSISGQEAFNYALRHVVEEELGGRLPYGAVLSRLCELAEGGRLGETLSLPGRLRVRRERDGLFFFYPDQDAGENGETEFILPDPPFDIRAGTLRLTAEWLPSGGMPPDEDMANPEVEWFNPAGIRWPLRLRPPRPGERFRPLGAPGSRKIQDILVDLKSPRRARGLPRVLADHAGALWLWPYRFANRVRLTGPITKALRIYIREEG